VLYEESSFPSGWESRNVGWKPKVTRGWPSTIRTYDTNTWAFDETEESKGEGDRRELGIKTRVQRLLLQIAALSANIDRRCP